MEWTYAVYCGCWAAAAAGAGLVRSERKRERAWNRERILTAGRFAAAELNERLNRRHEWRKQLSEFLSKTPLRRFGEGIERGAGRRMDLEIYEAISYLRNIAALGDYAGMGSADLIIEQLAEHKGKLQPIFLKMLQFLRMNQKEEAIRFFAEAVNTSIGKDFGRLLIQWDEIDPRELSETLLSHQKSIKEMRMTVQKRRDEMISDLVYLPVILNVMLIFINFIYVAYFIDQKDMLSILF